MQPAEEEVAEVGGEHRAEADDEDESRRPASQAVSDNSTINGLPRVFIDLGNVLIDSGIVRIPVYFLIAVATVAVAWFVLRFTIFGRFIYAIGNNEEAVRLSGHNPMPC